MEEGEGEKRKGTKERGMDKWVEQGKGKSKSKVMDVKAGGAMGSSSRVT